MARSLRRSGRRSSSLIQRSRALSPQQKAMFHNVAGAGRSRVKREFFDVSDQDATDLVAFLETRLDANLQGGTQ